MHQEFYVIDSAIGTILHWISNMHCMYMLLLVNRKPPEYKSINLCLFIYQLMENLVHLEVQTDYLRIFLVSKQLISNAAFRAQVKHTKTGAVRLDLQTY